MKNKTTFLLSFIVLAFVAVSCNKSTDDGIDIFIPNLSNNWTSSLDPDVHYFFAPTPGNENKNESDFTGNDGVNNLTGHYLNYDVSFTMSEGPEAGVKYSGKFIKGDPLKMQLHGTNGVDMTLTREE